MIEVISIYILAKIKKKSSYPNFLPHLLSMDKINAVGNEYFPSDRHI